MLKLVYALPGSFKTYSVSAPLSVKPLEHAVRAGAGAGGLFSEVVPALSAVQPFALDSLPVVSRWHCGFCGNPLAECVCYPAVREGC